MISWGAFKKRICNCYTVPVIEIEPFEMAYKISVDKGHEFTTYY